MVGVAAVCVYQIRGDEALPRKLGARKKEPKLLDSRAFASYSRQQREEAAIGEVKITAEKKLVVGWSGDHEIGAEVDAVAEEDYLQETGMAASSLRQNRQEKLKARHGGARCRSSHAFHVFTTVHFKAIDNDQTPTLLLI